MAWRTCIFAVDLGTSTSTSRHVTAQDSLDAQGNLQRQKIGEIIEVKDWPYGNNGQTLGDVCLPTELVFDRTTRKLLYFGFQARHYLKDPYPTPPLNTVYVVEHIKLLLLDPSDATVKTADSERRRALRDELTAVLGRDPQHVFAEFLDKIVHHILGSAHTNSLVGLHRSHVELVLAFPSGWPEHMHTMVAGIGASAMEKAIAAHRLHDIEFGMENVYTVSETLSGVREWLRDTISEADASMELIRHPNNLDLLNEDDFFLAADIGGGTGDLMTLRLVSKRPLQVAQFGRTRSLEVSGAAVEAEFERFIEPQVTPADYPDDISQLRYQICRRFKEDKKDCGLPHQGSNWNFQAPGLRGGRTPFLKKDHLSLEWKFLERSFDLPIDTLELEAKRRCREHPEIKMIVFLGQFGGFSAYLKKRMSESSLGRMVKIQYSQSGKLDVVKGAISDRLHLNDAFVPKFETQKSYGTLVTLEYYEGSEGWTAFPDARKQGAVIVRDRDGPGGPWLKVIEWAIPKNMTLANSRRTITSPYYHTWKTSQRNDISFEDLIIVSDEEVPPQNAQGLAYTLWTKDHEQNRLFVDGRRLQVQKIPFGWELSMSQKLDATGQLIGPYRPEDMKVVNTRQPHRKTQQHFILTYDLGWEITEMQVKLHVKAKLGAEPFTSQLAKQYQLNSHEKKYVSESRSQALQREIQIHGGSILDSEAADPDNESNGRHEFLNDDDIAGNGVRDDFSGAHRSPGLVGTSLSTSMRQPPSSFSLRNTSNRSASLPVNLKESESSSSRGARVDGRRREGCFNCKIRKRRCDCILIFNAGNGTSGCRECSRWGFDTCYMEYPSWAKDKSRVARYKGELQQKVALMKSKSRV